MEIYVHIPFCVKKCDYCDFLSAPADETVRSAYVNAIIREIRRRADLFEVNERVTSIYFGGGTPSTLNEKQTENILCAIREEFHVDPDAEITIEVNPKTVDRTKLHFLKEFGFNRLSVGMQSSYDDELKMLGRIHTYDDFVEAYINARDAGFTNISVDVMTALPGQDEKKLEMTLKRVIGLNPEHISAYSLIIEPGTPFFEKYGETDGPLVGEELERKLYHLTVSMLKDAGYTHYEISNFAKKGFESRHNTGYWKRAPYLGVGLGASSCLESGSKGYDEERTRNETVLEKYLENPTSYSEYTPLTQEDIIEETFFLGLRMAQGVNLNDFNAKFGLSAREIYGEEIEKLVAGGLIYDYGDRICLTDKGIDYGNYVFARFLIERKC